MKCIVLAGGKGDRLWPLSRKNYPKQFIQIQGDHSIFQETIARNIPYCDEFIVVTNAEYQFIVENQFSAFQGLVHRFVYEGEGRKTTAAIMLACMQLPLSETVLVVPADHNIAGASYKDELMYAKELSSQGKLVTFGIPINEPDERFGYIRYDGENVVEFTEKPDKIKAQEYQTAGDYLLNSGIFLFRVGDFFRELKKYSPDLYTECRQANKRRRSRAGSYLFPAEVMRTISMVAVEKAVFEKTENAKVIHATFDWMDIGSLEDLKGTELKTAESGHQVQYGCDNTDIFNYCPRRVVVANELNDVIVVNTKDAVYVGKKGTSGNLKTILEENVQIAEYVEGGRIVYRQWGSYEILVDTSTYQVRKVTVQPAKTIYAHKHMHRNENWTIVFGEAMVELAGENRIYKTNDTVTVEKETVHQVSNIGNNPLVFIEVSVGENVTESDNVAERRTNLTEEELGVATEDFVKLQPVFKDYLWGGTRLKDLYHKKCDYDVVAESWELAAHENGQCIVATGRHKGMNFSEYLSLIGKNNWGWKCRPMDAFPLMIKFIDAKEALSVQVHPGDDYALRVENQYGKNEMWYIVDCEENACLYCGFNRDVTKEEVEESIHNQTILELLNIIPVKKGDVFFVPAGTVHAIGAGILICEIQQSSDCTYRLYDYGRKDRFGNERELHIEKALDVLDYCKYEPGSFEAVTEEYAEYVKRIISSCKYFECSHYQIRGKMQFTAAEESFTSFVCIAGKGTLQTDRENGSFVKFKAGDSIFIPKSEKSYTAEGKCEIILTRI